GQARERYQCPARLWNRQSLHQTRLRILGRREIYTPETRHRAMAAPFVLLLFTGEEFTFRYKIRNRIEEISAYGRGPVRCPKQDTGSDSGFQSGACRYAAGAPDRFA